MQPVKQIEALFRLHEQAPSSQTRVLTYYAWPQLFGSTLGPAKGIGGQAMTQMTVHAWVDEVTLSCVYICQDYYWYEAEGFRPLKHVENWEKIPGYLPSA
jgi:hypothetical protein